MAKFIIAGIRDELAGENGEFKTPMVLSSYQEAERIFAHLVNSDELWRDNASDFSLWKLGEFDTNTGKIVSDPVKGVTGHTVLRKEN